MGRACHFRVEPRLIQVLGTQYRSTEEAIKELVANSWDADATCVEVSLPEPLSSDPIVVSDNGYGMTRRQLEGEFLSIAFDRRAKYGNVTPRGRAVRGCRGIGKFAGLVAADTMILQTTANGMCSRLALSRAQIEQQTEDLERVAINAETEPSQDDPGTIVELRDLRHGFSFPSPRKLGQVLLREFGRSDEFTIVINGEALTPYVLDAPATAVELQIPDLGPLSGTIWFANAPRAVPDPGILIRVSGRAIGPPTFFGLEKDPDVPKSLLNRVCGEVNADPLRDDIVAGWDAFIENSEGYQALVAAGREWLKAYVLSHRDEEAGEAQQEFVESYAEQIERLPLPRREAARQALLRVFHRLWDDPEHKKRAIAELVLNAFEFDEYWALVRRIDETPREDILRLAAILHEWGLSEVARVVQQARRRLKIVEAFEAMVANPETPELKGVHKALEQNAWLLSDEYELLKSNKGLRQIVRSVFGGTYTGDRPKDRPDLFLVGLRSRYLLVELKKPAETIDRDHVAQGQHYRDRLRPHLPNGDIELAVIGGKRAPYINDREYEGVLVATFYEVA